METSAILLKAAQPFVGEVLLELYREIRVENTLSDERGNEVGLKPDADVDVTIEADADATKPKNEPDEKRKK